MTNEGCQVNALVAYFGEQRDEPCGHCTFCVEGVAQQLPEGARPPGLDEVVDRRALADLAATQPAALGLPRQRARFLCGITSPATSRAKLTRGELFGVLADRHFAEVLGWCQAEGSVMT